LGSIILILGIVAVTLAALELYCSFNLTESWAKDIWRLFATSGLMMIPQLYSILDFTIGFIFIFCSVFIFRTKNMEFAALTALATGLVALFIYGIGDWWTYVARVKYEGLGVMYLRIVVQGAIPLVVSALSLTVQREEAKTLMGRRIRGFWDDFSHNKIGLVGAAILFAYIAAAVLVPVLSLGVNPDSTDLADELSPPSWTSIFIPSLSNLPRTTYHTLNWNDPSFTLIPEYMLSSNNITWTRDDGWLILNFSYVPSNESKPVCVVFESDSFDYPYDPPKGGGFGIPFDIVVETRYDYWYPGDSLIPAGNYTKPGSKYNIELNFSTPVKDYSMWDPEWELNKISYYGGTYNRGNVTPINMTSADTRLMQTEKAGVATGLAKARHSITLTSDMYWCHRMGFVNYAGEIMDKALSNELFQSKGNYSFKLYFFINATRLGPPLHFYAKIAPIKIQVKGMLWGFMGTDHLGRDIWSRIVHGVKISLAIGLAAAIASSFIGVVVGVIAGYVGGTTDELLMRLVDILLCLPVLPLLIVLVYMYGTNVWYIVILIAVFGWQGLSRVIRSQVLSLREAAFVECATASGASRTYIMVRHLVPNVLPIVLSDFVLSVPGGIMTEAGLSFIGFGDPSTPTWGREFNIMWTEGAAFAHFAWWWIIPPAVAITLLCLAFVFLGHAVDEIVNPKLRRRR